ncbi:Zinc Finger Mym-Type Protein 4 [Manis pentadactyla]|nr:Zinc Finger Mym-Type Protein 4 [Manis pentadactyla]
MDNDIPISLPSALLKADGSGSGAHGYRGGAREGRIRTAGDAPRSCSPGCSLAWRQEKVTIEPNEAMSEKEVPSEHLENKVSLKSTENRVSSKSVENKDTETNLQSKLWSSSFLKENSVLLDFLIFFLTQCFCIIWSS